MIIIDDDEDEVSEKGCDEPNSDGKLIVNVGEDLLQLVTQREGGKFSDNSISKIYTIYPYIFLYFIRNYEFGVHFH